MANGKTAKRGIQKYEESKKKTKTIEAASKKSESNKKIPEKVSKAVDKAVQLDKQIKEEIAAKVQLEAQIEKEVTRSGSTLVKDHLNPSNCSREQLIVEYAPLIKYIAQKIASRLPANIELDDLISSGVIGFMDSIDKFDSSRDNKFKTYAEFRIRGAILDELRAQDWVPRSVREKAKQLERCYAKLEYEKGRQATDEEVCEELNLSQEEYYELLNEVKSVSLLSYDDISNFSRTDKKTFHGLNDSDGRVPTPFSEVNSAYMKKVISEAIRDLPEKQRLVLSLYYYEDLNLKEIGKVLDVTESRVSQLHTQAILRLKARIRIVSDDMDATQI